MGECWSGQGEQPARQHRDDDDRLLEHLSASFFPYPADTFQCAALLCERQFTMLAQKKDALVLPNRVAEHHPRLVAVLRQIQRSPADLPQQGGRLNQSQKQGGHRLGIEIRPNLAL